MNDIVVMFCSKGETESHFIHGHPMSRAEYFYRMTKERMRDYDITLLTPNEMDKADRILRGMYTEALAIKLAASDEIQALKPHHGRRKRSK